MAITVVGSVAFDSIETPAGRRERCLGGAATYFSLAASFFTDVRVIAVVGEDFGKRAGGRLPGAQASTRAASSTPRARASSGKARISKISTRPRRTQTELNVFAAFEPKIPEAYRDSEFLFLANIDPVLAAARARGDARCEAGGRRHHELLDQGSSRRAAGSAEGPGHSAHQRHRNQDAGRQQQPGAGGARGAWPWGRRRWWSSTANMARRFFHSFDCKERKRAASSGRRRCRWKKWWIRPARATALPAASSATWPRSPSSHPPPIAAPCFTAA